MIPYWMEPRRAVPNGLVIDGMVVLTGPNTAGKSTVIPRPAPLPFSPFRKDIGDVQQIVQDGARWCKNVWRMPPPSLPPHPPRQVMRSVCAVSLLGNCGLAVPAARAEVPYQDGYFMKAASLDAPSEGLSAFAVEMLDVGTILRGTLWAAERRAGGAMASGTPGAPAPPSALLLSARFNYPAILIKRLCSQTFRRRRSCSSTSSGVGPRRARAPRSPAPCSRCHVLCCF
jgi:hypothetical protein